MRVPLCRRFVVLWLLCLTACGWLTDVAHAEQDFECGREDIEIGFDGQVPPGNGLVPVYVHVKNHRRSTTGVIEITQLTTTQEVRQLEQIDSPAPSEKRFMVLARLEDDRGINVRVSFDGDFAPASRSMNSSDRVSRPMVLNVGVKDEYCAILFNADDEQRQYAKCNLRREKLPDEALAYDMVHAVMITSLNFTQLGRNQTLALRDWVKVGGRLLIQGSQDDPAFAGKLAVFGVSPDVLIVPGVHSYGAGYIATDWTSPASATGRSMWERDDARDATLKFFPRLYTPDAQISYLRGNHGGIFSTLTKKEGSYGFAGFLWLTLIIVAYLAVIGPLDYYLVKRLRKPYLTWFFFLGAIICFSMIAYWYSSLVHSGRMQAIHVNLVDSSLEYPDRAVGNSIFWIYSTKNFRYRVTTEVPDVHFSAREAALGVGSAAGVDVLYNADPAISARIPIFTAKTFDATWATTCDYPISVGITAQKRFGVELPPNLDVDHVEIADADRLHSLSRVASTNRWIEIDAAETWTQVYRRMVPDPYSHGQQDYFDGPNDANQLPKQSQLDDYVRWISFAYFPPATKLPNLVNSGSRKDDDLSDMPGSDANNMDRRDRNFFNSGNESTQLEGRLQLIGDSDGREAALNIRQRVSGNGRVLMVYLKPSARLLPTEMSGLPPAILEVNVLRLQLPDDLPAIPDYSVPGPPVPPPSTHDSGSPVRPNQ